MKEKLRTVHIKPYLHGKGPTFTLSLYATDRLASQGRTYVGYRFVQHDSGTRTTLYEGRDFLPGASMEPAGNASIESLIGFLTHEPDEYERDILPEATRTFLATHAEAVSFEASCRFGVRS